MIQRFHLKRSGKSTKLIVVALVFSFSFVTSFILKCFLPLLDIIVSFFLLPLRLYYLQVLPFHFVINVFFFIVVSPLLSHFKIMKFM